MADKLLSLHVKGRHKSWSFEFMGDPKYIPEWEADGLEVWEVCNVIPAWVVDLGLTRLWVFAQDVFNFKNPWGRNG
ncbi:hypothetical protein [Stenotrophomonas maltophilia]|uniref:hypothetical protein n=1 Tax=Stenotrophomonas maltophilia TaxID=40324 RepID=UPI003D7C5B9C